MESIIYNGIRGAKTKREMFEENVILISVEITSNAKY